MHRFEHFLGGLEVFEKGLGCRVSLGTCFHSQSEHFDMGSIESFDEKLPILLSEVGFLSIGGGLLDAHRVR